MRKNKLFLNFAMLIIVLTLVGCAPIFVPASAPPVPTDMPVPPTDMPVPPTDTPVPPTPVPPTPVPQPTEISAPVLPELVANTIAEKCADCHTALPSGHAGEMNSEQCGLCHVPYGNTVKPSHLEDREACVDCHETPADTHFYLRDAENQSVLASDAETRCIACHRDGGHQTDGRGFPSLASSQDILAAVQLGTLRPWIQTGGFMNKYLVQSEVMAITDWIDEISADRPLSYDPDWTAAKIDADFTINGLGDNPAWDNATEHLVKLTPTLYTAADLLKLKAVYTDQYLYIRTEWSDSTASLTRAGSWLMEDGQWRHPKAATENDKQSEDRLSFIWNISTPNFRDGYGCALKCHGNVPGSSEFTDTEGAIMDIWHTKAGRGLGLYSATDNGNMTVETAGESFEASAGTASFSGVLDDKWLTWYMNLDAGYDLEDAGRRGDAGGGAYNQNRTGDKSGPLFIETAPESWADAMTLTKVETEDGSAIIADPTDPAYDAEAVATAWANYVALDAVVPERILKQPEGNRADVLHAATWQDGVWVNEMRRALVTNNPDDVQFDLATAMDYEFSVAVFDNCGRGEIPPGHTTYGEGQYQVLHFN